MIVLPRHCPQPPRAAQWGEDRWTGRDPIMDTKAVNMGGMALMVAGTRHLNAEHRMAIRNVDSRHGQRTGILAYRLDLRRLRLLTMAWISALEMYYLLGAGVTTVLAVAAAAAAREQMSTHTFPATAAVAEGMRDRRHRRVMTGGVEMIGMTEDTIETADTMIEAGAAGRGAAHLYEIATGNGREIVIGIFTGDSAHQERRQDSQDSIRNSSGHQHLEGNGAYNAVCKMA